MTRVAALHLTIRTPSHGVADGIRTRPFCLASRNAAANTTATWCTRTDSNRGPTPCEGGALPLSYGCMKDSVGKERNWTGLVVPHGIEPWPPGLHSGALPTELQNHELVERPAGLEPAPAAWEADVLPLTLRPLGGVPGT